jgi:geranyl-CoA carboxylase alpha subunit
MQRPQPDDATWALAAALLSGPATTRAASVARHDLTLVCNGQTRTLRAPPADVTVLSRRGASVRWRSGSLQRQALAVQDGSTLHLSVQGATFSFSEPSPYPANGPSSDPGRARAPVAGVVAQVAVAVGDRVAAGQPLVCVEAMKMEMWLHAAAAGTVRAVHVKLKDSVASGAVLVELEVSP